MRFRRIGDVPLGAVDEVVIALLLRAGSERSRIGTRAGLGQRKRTDDLTRGKPWQIPLLLHLGAVDHNPHAADTVVGAHDRTKHRRSLAQRHTGERLFLGGEAQAAVFLGYRQPKQPHAPHLDDDVGRDFIRLSNFALARD